MTSILDDFVHNKSNQFTSGLQIYSFLFFFCCYPQFHHYSAIREHCLWVLGRPVWTLGTGHWLTKTTSLIFQMQNNIGTQHFKWTEVQSNNILYLFITDIQIENFIYKYKYLYNCITAFTYILFIVLCFVCAFAWDQHVSSFVLVSIKSQVIYDAFASKIFRHR